MLCSVCTANPIGPIGYQSIRRLRRDRTIWVPSPPIVPSSAPIAYWARPGANRPSEPGLDWRVTASIPPIASSIERSSFRRLYSSDLQFVDFTVPLLADRIPAAWLLACARLRRGAPRSSSKRWAAPNGTHSVSVAADLTCFSRGGSMVHKRLHRPPSSSCTAQAKQSNHCATDGHNR